MSELMSQPITVKAGTKKAFISGQRMNIEDLYNRLKEEE